MITRLSAGSLCAPIAILASTAAHTESFQGFRVDLHGGGGSVSSADIMYGAMRGVHRRRAKATRLPPCLPPR